MKIPNIFIPERNLDEQTESLKHPKEIKRIDKIEKLTDFIIYKGLQPSRFGTYNWDFLPFLKQVAVDGLFIEYGLPIVEIIKFRNAHTLELNINGMLLENQHKFSDVAPYYVITNDVYAGFIHAEHKSEAKKITDNYIKKFGFEAHEIISGKK